ncbi:WxL protein peptidoglycan domain-containing protein [Virgibacillus xinjiangensis]|uniref:WxL protein peptidoglycan domain-containing protein n=1 Tax=Virgibacillus xinjiangensis TaxID=393090 RepID=A0ABV7CWB4_9BACI
MRFTLTTFCGILLLLWPMTTHADTVGSPIEIEPVPADNQNEEISGYFDLSVEPGQKQTIELKVTNNTEEGLILRGETVNAYTHPTGGMLYGMDIDSERALLLEDAVRLADYMEIDEEISVPPNSSVNVPVDITVPDVEAGTLLGAINLTTEPTTQVEEAAEEDAANFVLNTETTYSVAVQLNLPEEASTDFSLGEVGIISNTAEVYMEMTNQAQMIQENIKGTYTVSDEAGNELFSGDIPTFKMAPKSGIQYVMPWEHESLEDGDYTLTISGTAGTEQFAATETFTIANDDVQAYAERNMPEVASPVNQGISIWVWILAAAAFGIGMLFVGRKMSGSKSG